MYGNTNFKQQLEIIVDSRSIVVNLVPPQSNLYWLLLGIVAADNTTTI